MKAAIILVDMKYVLIICQCASNIEEALRLKTYIFSSSFATAISLSSGRVRMPHPENIALSILF